MNSSDTQACKARPAVQRSHRTLFGFAFASCATVALLFVVVFLAVQDLSTQYNLYYLMWKSGLRSYEPAVALGGLFHDTSYRDRLLGSSKDEFMRRFPDTFYKVTHRPPILKPNQDLYIDDYQDASREAGLLNPNWEATFQNDRLISFYYGKG